MTDKTNEGRFFIELMSDPDETQFVYDVINGVPPAIPSNEMLHRIYMTAASRVVKAPEEQKPGLVTLVNAVKSLSYSDEDFARADIVV